MRLMFVAAAFTAALPVAAAFADEGRPITA